jgi:hypothetical protein
VFANVNALDVTSETLNSAVVRLSGYDNATGDRAGITITTDGSAEDGYNLFNINGFNDSVSGQSLLFSRSRGTESVPTALQAEDELLGMYWFGADANGVPAPSVVIQALVGDTVGAGSVPGQLVIATADSTGIPTPALVINSDKKVDFGGPAKLAVYDNPTDRDAAITVPEAGMLIFIVDSTGAGGGAKVQVYDGGAWVNLF